MPARIFVLAGVNGAGKSSIGGAGLESAGARFYNPDLQARALIAAHPELSQDEANGQAWEIGRAGLERALAASGQFMFETTLGARTLASMLMQGSRDGADVHVWFAGLASPEMHMRRVKSRVAHGGHDIPELKIRQRYVSSLQNLIELMPYLASLAVFDNSEEADPKAGQSPRPRLILRMKRREISEMIAPAQVPGWAKPVVMQAIRLMKRKSAPVDFKRPATF
jgi:predicted ABC-type ATPase